MEEKLILPVKGNKEQKRVTIPKSSKIKTGDYVSVKKLDLKLKNEK